MNFFRSMISEGDTVSSKRWIAVTAAMCLNFGIVWTIVKYPQYITDTMHSTMVFVLTMSGVATVAQVVALFTKQPVKEEPTQP